MRSTGAIVEQWFAEAVASCSAETIRFLGTEKDPFRNPVGSTLKVNLSTVLEGVLGRVEPAVAADALAAIVRLRAIDAAPATVAVGFVFLLRPLLRELQPELSAGELDEKIDQLALAAFEEYLVCREKLFEIRLNESRRSLAVSTLMQARE